VATVGVLVLWFGWFGFNGGSALEFDETVPNTLVNTSLSATAGGFALLSWAWVKERKPDITASLNGTISGLVGVTAGAHVYEAVDAIIVGVVCAAACGLATLLLERWKIDDVIGAWPAHAVAGGVGTLMVAIVGDVSTDLVELVSEMDAHRQKGDFETPVTVEPHTEVGQIATEYNRVLDRVRLEIETREEAYRQLEEASEFRFIFENAHEGILQFEEAAE